MPAAHPAVRPARRGFATLALVAATVAVVPAGPAVAAPAKSGHSNQKSPGKSASSSSTQPINYPACDPQSGGDLTAVPWAQTRLRFDRAWAVTRGADVRVAVIDTGVNADPAAGGIPQMAGIHYADARTVLPEKDPGTAPDCDGHGTGVTGIIAAQPDRDESPFAGVAPDVTIIPIRQTFKRNTDGVAGGTVDNLVTAIRYAVDKKADVINLSLGARSGSPELESAVAYALAHDVLIVAASGNDGADQNLPAYPAAYSTKYDNVVAVGSIGQGDVISNFSVTGSFVDVVAPGDGVDLPAAGKNWLTGQSGTSFATPFVTGTAALVRAAHLDFSAAEVRARIEATADPPPADVPDPAYGYGVVNPYLAVTSVRDDDVPSPTPSPPRTLRAAAPVPPADRHLQHTALGFGLGLVALAVLAGVGATLARRRRSALGGLHGPR